MGRLVGGERDELGGAVLERLHRIPPAHREHAEPLAAGLDRLAQHRCDPIAVKRLRLTALWYAASAMKTGAPDRKAVPAAEGPSPSAIVSPAKAGSVATVMRSAAPPGVGSRRQPKSASVSSTRRSTTAPRASSSEATSWAMRRRPARSRRSRSRRASTAQRSVTSVPVDSAPATDPSSSRISVMTHCMMRTEPSAQTMRLSSS